MYKTKIFMRCLVLLIMFMFLYNCYLLTNGSLSDNHKVIDKFESTTMCDAELTCIKYSIVSLEKTHDVSQYNFNKYNIGDKYLSNDTIKKDINLIGFNILLIVILSVIQFVKSCNDEYLIKKEKYKEHRLTRK